MSSAMLICCRQGIKFVSDDGRDLIPQWAFFTRCIINMDDLTPTASREGFTRDGKLLRAKNQIEKPPPDCL